MERSPKTGKKSSLPELRGGEASERETGGVASMSKGGMGTLLFEPGRSRKMGGSDLNGHVASLEGPSSLTHPEHLGH